MSENYIKDYVVIDIDKYNNLQGENLYLREENKKLVNEIDIFKSFFIKTLLENEDYKLKLQELKGEDKQ